MAILWIFTKTFLVVSILLLHVAYVVYFERKVIGHMQGRMGPMRVGWHGLLQPIADGMKLFFKEDIIPSSADKTIFYIAPLIGILAAIVAPNVIGRVDDAHRLTSGSRCLVIASVGLVRKRAVGRQARLLLPTD